MFSKKPHHTDGKPIVLYAEAEDEVTDIVDRFRHADSDVVTLVLPRGAQLAQSLVNMKLLRREAEKLGLSLSLVTSDPIVQHLAEEAGLRSGDTVESMVARVSSEGITDVEQVATSMHSEGDSSGSDEDTPVHDDRVGVVPSDFSLRALTQDQSEEVSESVPVHVRHSSKSSVSQSVSVRDASKESDPVVADVVQTEGPSIHEYASDAATSDEQRLLEGGEGEQARAVVDATEEKVGEETGPSRQKKQYAVRPATRVKGVSRKQDKVTLLPSLTKTILSLVLLVGVGVGIAVVLWVLPAATVTFVPQTELLSADVRLVVSADEDRITQEEGVLAGVSISAQEESETHVFDATGQTTKEGGKARGTVRVVNTYTQNPQTLVETTRFLTDDGLLFRLTETVSVPGTTVDANGNTIPGVLDVTVEADEPGSKYNITVASFTLPGLAPEPRERITGEALDGFQGGADPGSGDVVVSQSDRERALDTVKSEASQRAVVALQNQVAIGEYVIEDAVRTDVIEVRSTADVGDQVETFEMSVTVLVRALVVSEEELRQVVLQNIRPLVQNGRALVDESLDGVTFSLAAYDTETESAELDLEVEKPLLVLVPEDEIRSQLSGKSADEVQNLLIDQHGVAAARVAFWPFWVEHVPAIPEKVQLRLDTSSINE